MFTGLIKEIGQVKQVTRSGQSLSLTVQCRLSTELDIGASVSINGACHTVVRRDGACFSVESSPETVAKTNLALLRAGDKVNLEPALTLSQGLDGHLVQGHIDGVGKVLNRRAAQNSVIITIAAQRELLRYLVSKGSVAVEGVSLTVVDCRQDDFSVCLIPHTAECTTLGALRAGSILNLEVDIISKYVARHLNPAF